MTERKPKTKKEFKPPRKPTAQRLANIALHHLDRYASSADNLKRVLERRVFKAAPHHDDFDVAEAQGWIDDIVARYVASGLLDDRAYAETRARSLLARGNSQRQIRMKLMAKGLGADDIDTALGALKEDHMDPELAACAKLVRRRRLGPYCDPDKRAARAEKDMATLARSGFSYDMAKRVIEAEDVDTVEDWLAAPPFTGPSD